MPQGILQKLRVQKYGRKAIRNIPPGIETFGGLEYDDSLGNGPYDFIFSFVFSLREMADLSHRVSAENLLTEGGALYFAYPKKGNRTYEKYIGRDDIFPFLHVDEDTGFIGGTTLKFNHMVAFDDVFTAVGLKNTTGKQTASHAPSQRVDDYAARAPELERHLKQNTDTFQLFDALTPGYKRNWVRYVYSARTQATMEKRFAEMETLLRQGYKSIELYRQSKR